MAFSETPLETSLPPALSMLLHVIDWQYRKTWLCFREELWNRW